jgi:hypothetical protein
MMAGSSELLPKGPDGLVHLPQDDRARLRSPGYAD